METAENQYWIVVGRNHAGPYTTAQLKAMGIAPDTYAWHRGLTQWVAASEIPELAAELWPAVQPPAPSAPVVAEDIVVESVRMTPPAPPMRVAVQQPSPAGAQASAVQTSDDEACPSGYLWWSIVVAALFSLPLGVIAIIFAAQVKRLWRDGDYAGARRSSERAYWFSIIGFVTGLMIMPFQIAALLL